MVSTIHQPVRAPFYNKTAVLQQMADLKRVMDILSDVLFKIQPSVFIHTDLQIYLTLTRACHLKPDPDLIRKIQFKGFAGGDFPFIQNIKDEVSTFTGVSIYIFKDPPQVL